MCSTHHTLVDSNGGAGYSVETLIKMRERHEDYQSRRERIEGAIRAYLGVEYDSDDKVLFEQVDLHGPSVDSMFVDVPFTCRSDARVAGVLARIAASHPADREAVDAAGGHVVTGAAQALLHPEWSGSALLIGGPGQGKSTLLQYVCQFHRARRLGRDSYTGERQKLTPLTDVVRLPVRLDLRKYAIWASTAQARTVKSSKGARKGRTKTEPSDGEWPSIEQYIATEIRRRNGGKSFSLKDFALLVSTEPVLLALDGLDEVANLKHRERVGTEIVETRARLDVDASDLVVLVATRPGGAASALWSSEQFPILNLQRLSQGLRLQYLQQWASVAKLTKEATAKLQRTFMDNQNVPHIRELASYPMQVAILLHLLYRRQLLPQQRTELYREYLKTFLDREQGEDKEPLLAEERQVIEDVHAILGWHLQAAAEAGKSTGSIKRSELKALLREHLDGRDDGQKLAERLFSALTTRVLCLVERDTGSFQFEVQSLREYFAALYIFENAPLKGANNSRDDCLDELLLRSYWSNVCRFFVGMFSSVEVRGLRSSLVELARTSDLPTHALLRSSAALFLDDRTYEGQKDQPIREIVDFILDGPGVVLAEDGLLDGSGSALLLAERAGRSQAVRHLKSRLEGEQDASVRRALAGCLSRHAAVCDALSAWWWSRFEPTWQWLETAGQLRVLSARTVEETASLAKLLAGENSSADWATEQLARGGFNGAEDEVLTVVVREINEGAAEVLSDTAPSTSVGRLLIGATIAVAGGGPTDPADHQTVPRTRVRRSAQRGVLQRVVAATDQLRTRPDAVAGPDGWAARLILVGDVWGDGWVLRQAVAALPYALDLDVVLSHLPSAQADVLAAVETEAAARSNRGNASWWTGALTSSASALATRHWVFSLLGSAHASVVAKVAEQLNAVVSQLAPKYIRVLRRSLQRQQQLSVGRTLGIVDPLRLKQAHFSPRSLWLLRAVATEASIEQIDKRLSVDFAELLQPGLGDMRELIRVVGQKKTIKPALLRTGRAALPIGGWASNAKLGKFNADLREDALRTPENWPGDLVQRAAAEAATQFAKHVLPIASVASANGWFPGS